MFASVVYGADREIYLKCLSVCAGVESTDTWEFHLATEREFLGECRPQDTYISDRKPGLLGTIETVHPDVHIAACCTHLVDNLQKSKLSFTHDAINI